MPSVVSPSLAGLGPLQTQQKQASSLWPVPDRRPGAQNGRRCSACQRLPAAASWLPGIAGSPPPASLPTQHFRPCFPTALCSPAPQAVMGASECVIPIVVENVSEPASQGDAPGTSGRSHRAELRFSQQGDLSPSPIAVALRREDAGLRAQGSSPRLLHPPKLSVWLTTIVSGPPVLIFDTELRISGLSVFLGC